jgi:hypothetical protein
MIIPFGAGIREKVYYKFYEMGNNGLYIPSIAEVDEEEENNQSTPNNDTEEINVEN